MLKKRIIASITALCLLLAPFFFVKAESVLSPSELARPAGSTEDKLLASDLKGDFKKSVFYNDNLYFLDLDEGGNQNLYKKDINTEQITIVDTEVHSFIEEGKNYHRIIYSKYTDGDTGYDPYMLQLDTGVKNLMCAMPGNQFNISADGNVGIGSCQIVFSEDVDSTYKLVYGTSNSGLINTTEIISGNDSPYKALIFQKDGQEHILYTNNGVLYYRNSGGVTENISEGVDNFTQLSNMGVYYDTTTTGNGDIYYYDFSSKSSIPVVNSPKKEFSPSFGYDQLHMGFLRASDGNGYEVMSVLPSASVGSGFVLNELKVVSQASDSSISNLFYGSEYSVWSKNVDGKVNLYGFNVGSLDRYGAKAYGDKLFWADKRNGKYYQIYMKDMKTGVETKVSGSHSGYGDIRGFLVGDGYVAYAESPIVTNETNFNYTKLTLYNIATGERVLVSENSMFAPVGIGGGKLIYVDYPLGSPVYKVYDLQTTSKTDFPFSSSLFWSVTGFDGRYAAIVETNIDTQKMIVSIYDFTNDRVIKVSEQVYQSGKGGGVNQPKFIGSKLFWTDGLSAYIYDIELDKLTTLNDLVPSNKRMFDLEFDGTKLAWSEAPYGGGVATGPSVLELAKEVLFGSDAYAATDFKISIYDINVNKLLASIGLNSIPSGDTISLANNVLYYQDTTLQGYTQLFYVNIAGLKAETGLASILSQLPRTGIALLYYALLGTTTTALYLNRKKIFRKKKVWE